MKTVLYCGYFIVYDGNFDWKSACLAREDFHRLWCDDGAKMEQFSFREGLIGSVDGLHIMEVKLFLVHTHAHTHAGRQAGRHARTH